MHSDVCDGSLGDIKAKKPFVRLVPKADVYHSVALMGAAQRRADKSEQPD